MGGGSHHTTNNKYTEHTLDVNQRNEFIRNENTNYKLVSTTDSVQNGNRYNGGVDKLVGNVNVGNQLFTMHL